MTAPRISVITSCLNSSETIRQTLASVASQRGIECEHVIADGGSTDATLAIVQAALRPGGQCVSAPDDGIADAMNKGLALARGEWLLFLQSDDYLLGPNVLAEAARWFRDEVDVCGFPVDFGTEGQAKTMHPRGANPWLNFKTGLNHQGTFIRKSLFDRIGPYDTAFRIAMDYEFFLRAYRSGARFECHASPVVALMRDSGISSQRDWPNLQCRLGEERRVHHKWVTPALAPLYWAWWATYPRYRQLHARLSRATTAPAGRP
jgi:glycosyltransferase involved in cell wall biosynthesis